MQPEREINLSLQPYWLRPSGVRPGAWARLQSGLCRDGVASPRHGGRRTSNSLSQQNSHWAKLVGANGRHWLVETPLTAGEAEAARG